MHSEREVEGILRAINAGDSKAAEELLPLVYGELRKLAHRWMAKEPPGQTLPPTALVHEAYVRLVSDPNARFQNRAHFFAAAAVAMRRILVERARRHRMAKHGGEWSRVSLDEMAAATPPRSVDLLALDRALDKLQAQDSRLCSVVMLRFFVGLEIDETAHALGVSPSTVHRDWNYAKAWLYDEISRSGQLGEGERL